MRTFLRFAVVSLIVTMGFVASPKPSPAQGRLQEVVVHNESDAWAWITTYQRDVLTRMTFASCVAPHRNKILYITKTDVHDVRAEVTHKNCTHPVMLDRKLGYDGKTPYYVTGSNGKYKFWHTP